MEISQKIWVVFGIFFSLSLFASGGFVAFIFFVTSGLEIPKAIHFFLVVGLAWMLMGFGIYCLTQVWEMKDKFQYEAFKKDIRKEGGR